jgi:hypothetical protein
LLMLQAIWFPQISQTQLWRCLNGLSKANDAVKTNDLTVCYEWMQPLIEGEPSDYSLGSLQSDIKLWISWVLCHKPSFDKFEL